MKSADFLEKLNNLCGEYAYSYNSLVNYLESFPLHRPSQDAYTLEILDKINSGNFTREEYQEYLSWVFDFSDRVGFDYYGEIIKLTFHDLKKTFYEDLKTKIFSELDTEYQKFYSSLRTLGSLTEIQEEIFVWQIEVDKYKTRYRYVVEDSDYIEIYKVVTGKLKAFGSELAMFGSSDSIESNIFNSYPRWGEMPSSIFYKILEKLVFTDDAGFISKTDFDTFIVMVLSGQKHKKIKLKRPKKGDFLEPFCLLKYVNEDLFSAQNRYSLYIELVTGCFDVDWSPNSIMELMKKRTTNLKKQYSPQKLKSMYLNAKKVELTT